MNPDDAFELRLCAEAAQASAHSRPGLSSGSPARGARRGVFPYDPGKSRLLVVLFDRRRDDGAPRKPPPPERRDRAAPSSTPLLSRCSPCPAPPGRSGVARCAADRRAARPQCTPLNSRPATAGAQHGLGLVGPGRRRFWGGRSRRASRVPGGGGGRQSHRRSRRLAPNSTTCQPAGDGGGGRGHELVFVGVLLASTRAIREQWCRAGAALLGFSGTPQLLVPRKDCGARRKLSALPAARR